MRRPQSTIANNKLSNPELVSCGVSQGSILCPLFFLVNINDLMSSLKLVSVQMQGGEGGWRTYPLAMHGQSALQVLSSFSAWPLRWPQLPETDAPLPFYLPPGGAGTPTQWQCAATLHCSAFPILSLITKVPTSLRDNCSFTFPLPTLPPPP